MLPFNPEGFPVVNVLNLLHNGDNALALDATNVPPLALLAGATFTGPATPWGSQNKLELVGSIDQAGTLFIDQSRDGGATWPAALTEQWLGALGEAFAFPTARAVGANAYRLRFTAGGVALAALILAPYLTTGPIDQETPIIRIGPTTVATGGAGHTFVRPVGARSLEIGSNANGAAFGALLYVTEADVTGAAAYGCAWGQSSAGYTRPARQQLHTLCTDGVTRSGSVWVRNIDAADAYVWVDWY